MTKEDILEAVALDVFSLVQILDEFFSQNVVIPRGENRHKDADIIHAYAEGLAEIEVLRSEGWTEFKQSGMCLCIGDEYRIKPSEPVYEWQWSYTVQGIKLISNEFMTECEVRRFIDTPFTKVEETKRVREETK